MQTPTPTAKHLWECDHSYYCNEGNYFSSNADEPFMSHESFADFLSEEGESDKDYNLLFRWDWKEVDEETGECNFYGDNYYRNGKLLLFFMGQRKGLYRWVEVEVCRADEPSVIKYLAPRWQHMQELWAPLACVQAL
jgi:hypothetical protein